MGLLVTTVYVFSHEALVSSLSPIDEVFSVTHVLDMAVSRDASPGVLFWCCGRPQ
jgi:hypothetical protein